MKNAEKMYGLQNLQKYLKVPTSMDLRLLERMQKYVIAHLSAVMLLLEKVQWLEILQN